MHFLSVVINVEDLDRSIDFYRDVFGFTVLSRQDQLAAVYAAGEERPQVIVLRAFGTTGRVGGGRHVGMRAFLLEVGSVADLDRIAASLSERASLEGRHTGDTWTAVYGRDPDDLAVVICSSLTPGPIDLESWASLDESLYGLGE